MTLSNLVPVDVAAAALGLDRAEFVWVARNYFRSAEVVASLTRLLDLEVVPGDLVAALIRDTVREAHADAYAAA